MGFQFFRVQSSDQTTNRLQSSIQSSLNNITGPFINGQLLVKQAISTGGTTINHGLGKQPQVWVVCDQDTNTSIWRTAWSSNTISLKSGSNCTVSIWVG